MTACARTHEEPRDEMPEAADRRRCLKIDSTSAPRERVAAALAALPARQREALVLQYYQELSNIDAAALMGISVDALESLLARARRNLRAQLAGSGLSKDKS